jgi:hypothetical protein
VYLKGVAVDDDRVVRILDMILPSSEGRQKLVRVLNEDVDKYAEMIGSDNPTSRREARESLQAMLRCATLIRTECERRHIEMDPKFDECYQRIGAVLVERAKPRSAWERISED